jgi:uncharacterized coiled-coil DUF342 family protein
MAIKYKDYLKQMYEEHQELFDSFDKVHAEYVLDKSAHQQEYNEKGREVMRVVEEWESRLCSRMEKGKHSSFSHRLADKFKEELRVRYPKIDFIGVEISKPDNFSFPRIDLS